MGAAKIGIDKLYVDASFVDGLTAALPECEISDGTRILSDLRAVKSVEEIECLSEAAKITEEAFEAVTPIIKEGTRLIEIKQKITQEMTQQSGGEVGHITLKVGPAKLPPGEKLEAGDILCVDCGAKFRNYRADISRQWAIGKVPATEWDTMEVISAAVDAMRGKLRPGTKFSEIYRAGNDIMAKVNPRYKGMLLMGHSLGIESHERPYISPDEEKTLEPGMVLCLEVPHKGTYVFNCEDEYLITQDGYKIMTARTSSRLKQV